MATAASISATKLGISFILFLSAIFATVAAEDDRFVRTVDRELFGLKKEKLTHFRLYWHDILTGKNPSAVQILPPLSNASRTGFGLVRMIDNPLTAGPELSSKLLGRAQGLYASAAQEGFSLLMVMNFGFVEGKYNGSSVTVMGRNQVSLPVREMPVIGGSGRFRFARGYVEARTRKLNTTTGDATGSSNMAKVQCVIFFLVSSYAINFVSGEEEFLYSRTLDQKSLGLRKEKLSHFRFFWHDIITGKNPSAVLVIPPVNTSKTNFGAARIIDNPLTEGPKMSSRLLGRAQGLYAAASQEEVALLMAMNFAFTQGKYNGSTITVFGRNPVFEKVREMPVIGGSGLFRFARGYAQAKTYKFDSAGGDAIIEYNVFVLHY